MTAPARRTAVVAVVGGGDAAGTALADAEEVGRLLAQRSAVVKTGGRGGVAAAACRGAVLAGGLTVGVLPGRSRDEANPYVTIPIPTGLGDARNALVVTGVDAVIALAGRFGTLTEIGHALLAGTPVIGLGTWDLPGSHIVPAGSPREAVETALEFR